MGTVKEKFLSVPNYPGARLLNTQTEMRVFSVPIGIIAPSGIDINMLSEDIANWLITDQPKELIFDTDPDRTYLAVVDEEFDVDEFVDIGKGNLKFVCSNPYKLGPIRTVGFQTDGPGLIANVQNKGTVESEPIIEIEVENSSTFLDVWRGMNTSELVIHYK